MEIYENLILVTVGSDDASSHDGYWYLVRTSSTSHYAFRRRASLLRFLDERGLSLSRPLAPHRTASVQRIIGKYGKEMVLSEKEFDDVPDVLLRTRALSNGQYVHAKIAYVAPMSAIAAAGGKGVYFGVDFRVVYLAPWALDPFPYWPSEEEFG